MTGDPVSRSRYGRIRLSGSRSETSEVWLFHRSYSSLKPSCTSLHRSMLGSFELLLDLSRGIVRNVSVQDAQM